MAFWRIHKLYFLICKIDRTLRQVVEQLNEIIQVPGAVHGMSISAPCNLDRLWWEESKPLLPALSCPTASSYIVNEHPLGCALPVVGSEVFQSILFPHFHVPLRYPPTFCSLSHKSISYDIGGDTLKARREGTSPKRSREKIPALKFLPPTPSEGLGLWLPSLNLE